MYSRNSMYSMNNVIYNAVLNYFKPNLFYCTNVHSFAIYLPGGPRFSFSDGRGGREGNGAEPSPSLPPA